MKQQKQPTDIIVLAGLILAFIFIVWYYVNYM